MPAVFLVSDTHFGHTGVCRFLCNDGSKLRPWDSPEEMDEATGGVFFTNLEDGDTVSNPVYVEFGVEGMDVRPAGEIVEGTGHHHLLIGNAFLAKGEVVPADENNIHYGGGQTSDTVTLPMGEVRLGMQFANGVHASYGRDMSASIKVFVK